MMSKLIPMEPQSLTPSADDVIMQCMSPDSPKSFFLYAGAGSGKTRSLVKSLDAFRSRHGRRFNLNGRKIGIITYTNAARDEIERRLMLDPLFHVSTIHSFCWFLIQGLHLDIRHWLKVKLPTEIVELQAEQAKGRPGTKAAQDRERGIRTKTLRLQNLDSISKFVYNPNGDNYGEDLLSHTEVIQITSSLLQEKPLMQALLVNQCPILLIDESQDTNANLMDAFFAVERRRGGSFALGLFGDTMQRIYSDGKHDLGRELPEHWAKPTKLTNHRSAKRIVQLGNALRRDVDGHQQTSPDDKPTGTVRLFVTQVGADTKPNIEQAVKEKMAEIAGDAKWREPGSITVLALEHHMAAARLGFAEMFQPLYAHDRLKRGLIDGDLPSIRLFSERVLPLVEAAQANDRFTIAELMKQHSPLLKRDKLLAAGQNQRCQIAKAQAAVQTLSDLTAGSNKVTFLQILRCVADNEIFEIPAPLLPFVEGDASQFEEEDEAEQTGVLASWRQFLESPFFQIVNYKKYVTDAIGFDTHHGVKGLEFKRVMVLLDDSESRGFMYSYEKLLGVVPPSKISQILYLKKKTLRRIEAQRRKARALWFRHSQSLANLRQRLSQPMVLSTIQRLGRTTNVLAAFERLTISKFTWRMTRWSAALNCVP